MLRTVSRREANPAVVTRIPRPLLAAIDEDAGREGISRSEWMRTVVETALTWNWMARNRPLLVRSATTQVQANGGRRLGMSVWMPAGECLHPPTAREQMPTEVRCGMCGHTLKTLTRERVPKPVRRVR